MKAAVLSQTHARRAGGTVETNKYSFVYLVFELFRALFLSSNGCCGNYWERGSLSTSSTFWRFSFTLCQPGDQLFPRRNWPTLLSHWGESQSIKMLKRCPITVIKWFTVAWRGRHSRIWPYVIHITPTTTNLHTMTLARAFTAVTWCQNASSTRKRSTRPCSGGTSWMQRRNNAGLVVQNHKNRLRHNFSVRQSIAKGISMSQFVIVKLCIGKFSERGVQKCGKSCSSSSGFQAYADRRRPVSHPK